MKRLVIYHFYVNGSEIESDFGWDWIEHGDPDHEEKYYKENEMDIENAIDFYVVQDAVYSKDLQDLIIKQ